MQQQVADVTAEAVVHVAQVIDVEGDDRRAAPAGPSRRCSKLIEPLAEQRALRKPGQRIEIREELERVFLLPVLQREGQVRNDVLQQPQLFVAQQVALARGKRERADARCRRR